MKSLFCTMVILLMLAGQDFFGQPPVTPQRNDELLAEGNPPLTLTLSDRLVEFFEWSLASKFTKSQRALFTMRLLQVWEKRDQSKIDALVRCARFMTASQMQKRGAGRAHVGAGSSAGCVCKRS